MTKGLRAIADRDLGRIRTSNRWRFSNPIMAGVREIINQPLYDTVSVAVATAFPVQSIFFQTPIGQAGATQLQTNMTQAGLLPSPRKFSVRALRLMVRNDANQTDLVNFLFQTWLQLFVSDKPYWIGPSFLWTAGGGAKGNASQLGTVAAGDIQYNLVSNGVEDQRNIYALSRPIEIEQNEQFRLELNTGTAFNTVIAASRPLGTGLTVVAILDGELSRGVS